MPFIILTGPDTSRCAWSCRGRAGGPRDDICSSWSFYMGKLRLREVICFVRVPQGDGYCGEQFHFPDPAFEWVKGSGEESP